MTTCFFCKQPTVPGGYIQPPMCEKHHALAILISLLKSRGQLASLENIRLLAGYYRLRTGLDPAEIEALIQPMKGVLDSEQAA